MSSTKTLTKQLLKWHSAHGRSDLPWQNTTDAYRIWLSEIMLQQTQVSTVIPYFERFIKKFATITELANAPLDEVLHLWTGLGYYARARNLHKTANIISSDYDGVFPIDFEDVLALPGIGKSTAGAILAFSESQHHAILDGNVKRVLSRFYAVGGWYGHKPVETKLWLLAELNTPKQNVAQYTQAIMDFGATLCTRSKPACKQCPFKATCTAYKTDRVAELPHSKPKTNKPVKTTNMLFILNEDNDILLLQRPPTGIWGGLWCPIEVDELNDEMLIDGLTIIPEKTLPILKHVFSHYTLNITPVIARLKNDSTQSVNESQRQIWYKTASPAQVGLAAPVKKIIGRLSVL